MFLLLSFFHHSHKKKTHTHFFKRLIYEIQNNLHQLTTHMLTLVMWHNKFSENENEAVEAHVPQHRYSKTKKPWHRDSKAKKPRHRETETINPRHRDSKTLFQRTKCHDIEILRLKNQDIEIPRQKSHGINFPRNSDPYAPWYPVFRRCSVVPQMFRVPSFRVPVFLVL